MPLKIELALKFFTALKYFYLSEFLRNLRLPWKQSLSWNFSLYLIYFLDSGCLINFCLPWKTECALNSPYWMYIFYHLEFWTTRACPEKQKLPWNFSLYGNIFYLSGFLSSLCLPWKTECALNSPIECIFYPSGVWTTCACPEKQNMPWNFSLYWNLFYLSGFLRNLSLPWKQSLPWFFQAGGEAASPPRTPLVMNVVCFEWSVMNGSVMNGNHFEALLCFHESRLSNCLL